MTVLGLVLLVVGAVLAASEVHNPTHGVAGGAGVFVMAAGVVLAVSGLGAAVWIGVLGGLALAASGGGLLTATVAKGMSARHRRVRTGAEGLVGTIGVVRSWDGPSGSVLLRGSLWQARGSALLSDGPAPALQAGDTVVVESIRGLTVAVRHAEEWELD